MEGFKQPESRSGEAEQEYRQEGNLESRIERLERAQRNVADMFQQKWTERGI